MDLIRDRDGNVIQRSRNLAGIRRYVGKHIIKTLDVSTVGYDEGKLSILFDDGASFEANFASYDVLTDFVRRWRNVRGATLTVNGQPAGDVSSNNPPMEKQP